VEERWELRARSRRVQIRSDIVVQKGESDVGAGQPVVEINGYSLQAASIAILNALSEVDLGWAKTVLHNHNVRLNEILCHAVAGQNPSFGLVDLVSEMD
jgi:hypothetical protein